MSITRAFDEALDRSKKDLPDKEKADFAVASMQDVYNEAEKIQKKQSDKRSLRNMRRIEPYLKGLAQFSAVIEVFVQAKPEIMAFIWGPTKLLLQVANTYIKSLDKILDAFQRIGENLPRFENYAEIFYDNQQMQKVISLMYEDILNFHRFTLKFFRKRGWQQMFTALWGTFDDTFGVILGSLSRHKDLVDNEATAAHIAAAYEDRKKALREDEQNQKDRVRRYIRDLKEWLVPASYETEQTACREIRSRYIDTGNWLPKDHRFKAWLDPQVDGSFLWLTGIPGSGKTILASLVADYTKLFVQGTGSVLSVFLKHGNRIHKENSCAGIMRTLIYQLLLQNQHILPYMNQIYESSNYVSPTSREELEGFLQVMLGNTGAVYLVMDGLDELESSEGETLLSGLLLIQSKNSNLKIFLSSRSEANFSKTLSKVPQIKIGEANKRDIATYAAIEGRQLVEKFDLDDNDVTRKEIKEIVGQVANSAQGMFLWVRLVIYNLMQQTNLEELERAAKDLPKGLEEAYGRIIARIDIKLGSNEREQARRILQWVSCANRPLTMKEIEFALAIRLGDRSFVRKRKLLRQLDELCGPILEINKNGIVNFVHFSANEYLISKFSGPYINTSAAHLYIAQICVSYLSFTCFNDTLDEDTIINCIYNGDYCLDHYAEANWLEHVKHVSERCDGDLQGLYDLTGVLKSFIGCRWNTGYQPLIFPNPKAQEFSVFQAQDPHLHKTLLYLYTYRSCRHHENLLSGGPGATNPLNLQSVICRVREIFETHVLSPQNGSAEECHLKSVREIYGTHLFKCREHTCLYFYQGFKTPEDREKHSKKHIRSFKCDITGCQFHSLGFISAQALAKHHSDHHKSVIGVDVATSNNLPGDISKSLENTDDFVAMVFDSVDTDNNILLGRLLSRYLDSEAQERLEQPCNLLQRAVDKDSENCVRLLLGNGRNVSDVDIVGALRGSESLVSILIDNGVDPSTTVAGNSLLLHAVKLKNYALAKLLLERGANVATMPMDAMGGTPLNEAWKRGLWEIAQLLLDFGAPEQKDRSGGRNAGLILAVKTEKEAMVQLLLKKGVHIRTRNIAMAKAILKRSERMIQMFLDAGPPIYEDFSTFEYILNLAVTEGGEDIVRLLLKNGPSAPFPDRYIPFLQETLVTAVGKRSEAIVQMLLNAGAPAHSGFGYGSSALTTAAANGDERIVQLLLENGPNAPFPDRYIPSLQKALESAVGNRSEAIVQMLLNAGAPAHSEFGYGSSTLTTAAANGDERIVQLLLENGPNAPFPDCYIFSLRRALLSAVRNRSEAVVQLLLNAGAPAHSEFGYESSALTTAAANGDERIVQLLVENGPVMPFPDAYIRALEQALIKAVSFRSEVVVSTLLDVVASTPGFDGANAMNIALKMGSDGIVQLLLEYGVKVELEVAIEYQRETIVRQFLEQSTPDFLRKGAGGETIIQVATRVGHKKILQYLLNSRSPGYLDLIDAIENGVEAKVRLLLRNGFDVSGEEGFYALGAALEGQEEGVVQALIEYGVDRRPEQALCIAIQKGWEVVVRILLWGGNEEETKVV